MFIKRNWLAALISLAALGQALAQDGIAPGDVIREPALKYRDLFMQAESRMDYTSSAINPSEFYAKLENGSLTDAQCESFLITCASYSRRCELRPNKVKTGYVLDEEVVELLIAALKSPYNKTRTHASYSLVCDVGNRLRHKYSAQIKEALGEDASSQPKNYLLLSKSKPTEAEQHAILSHPGLNDPVIRILCGDSAAEADLIARFHAEKDYRRKRKLVEPLALAGTDACAVALVDGLDSPVELQADNWHYSIRFDIIRSLGLIFEDEPLFTEKAYLLRCCEDEQFDREVGLKQYVNDVDRWVRNHFGHPAWNRENVWFRTVEVEPIVYEYKE